MSDELHLETEGATRAEALSKARASAAKYFGTDKDKITGEVVHAGAVYDGPSYISDGSTVIGFTVTSVWRPLDSNAEWLVG